MLGNKMFVSNHRSFPWDLREEVKTGVIGCGIYRIGISPTVSPSTNSMVSGDAYGSYKNLTSTHT